LDPDQGLTNPGSGIRDGKNGIRNPGSGMFIPDPDPGSGNEMFIPDPGSWIRSAYPGSATLILAQKILNNAIMKCEDLIKNI
jgi:hypothetical protein